MLCVLLSLLPLTAAAGEKQKQKGSERVDGDQMKIVLAALF